MGGAKPVSEYQRSYWISGNLVEEGNIIVAKLSPGKYYFPVVSM